MGQEEKVKKMNSNGECKEKRLKYVQKYGTDKK
jgi:hypothetical protein